MRAHIVFDRFDHTVFDKLNRRYTFHIQSFRAMYGIYINDIDTIFFDFSDDFIDSLREQNYHLDKIKLVFLFNNLGVIESDQHDCVKGIYHIYGIYIKKDDIDSYHLHQKSRVFITEQNCILIHPNLITTVVPNEIVEYFRNPELYDIGLSLLKKRLCKEIMIDIDSIRRPIDDYDNI